MMKFARMTKISPAFVIHPATMDWHGEVLGYDADEPATLKRYLDRNPGPSLVAAEAFGEHLGWTRQSVRYSMVCWDHPNV